MKIVLTGGGTAGHAMVGSVLIPLLIRNEWKCVYIGSGMGMEKKMIEKQGLINYYKIPTGKLRRYFSMQNFLDPIKILLGIMKAYYILKREAPHVVFSGGGYVSVPVVVAAKLLRIPVVLRETDCTMGLSNRIGLWFATAASITFPVTASKIKQVSLENHGMIVRPEILQVGKKKFEFSEEKPTLLVMGGSLGARAINEGVRKDLPLLLKEYNVIHLCGVNNMDPRNDHLTGYRQLEFLEDMASAYEVADFILMRCGSNAVCEGLALGKNMICVPLSQAGSRGEQRDNAIFAVENGNAFILEENILCGKSILEAAKGLTKQPKNITMKLNPLQLKQNCMAQITQLYTVALEKLENDFMEHINHGKKIDFFSLTEDELLYYNEFTEEYWEEYRCIY